MGEDTQIGAHTQTHTPPLSALCGQTNGGDRETVRGRKIGVTSNLLRLIPPSKNPATHIIQIIQSTMKYS